MDFIFDNSAEMHSNLIRLFINVVLSALASGVLFKYMPRFRDMFLKADLKGTDLNKKDKYVIPESYGVISGAMFLILLFVFIPLRFYEILANNIEPSYHHFIQHLAALLCICCMIFLGFADDVLDLKWRDKVLLPAVASLPLLMVYLATNNSTTIIVPKPLRFLIGFDLHLGILYYVYIGMLAVFCTNAINIYAGINGIEVGQSLVIAFSILVENFIEFNGKYHDNHYFSLFLIIPYIFCTLPLFHYNKYPSQVFVGDTFCYFSGMTFAVIGILGHFSKFLLLFFIPQIFNFLLSIPQLFKFVPCPRHRLPKYNPTTDKLEPSVVVFTEKELNSLGKLTFYLFRTLGLIKVKEIVEETKENKIVKFESTNFTIINLALNILGPKRENHLTAILLVLQVICSLFAFLIRYQLSKLFYE